MIPIGPIAKARQAIAEQQQIAQLDNDRMADITKDLRYPGQELKGIPKAVNANAVLGRMEIRAHYAGRVVALNVFSVGDVSAAKDPRHRAGPGFPNRQGHRRPARDVVQSFLPAEMKRFGAGSS